MAWAIGVLSHRWESTSPRRAKLHRRRAAKQKEGDPIAPPLHRPHLPARARPGGQLPLRPPGGAGLGDREHPLLFPADVTFLVGENGTGKSTLLEAVAVACGFNAEGGTRNFDFSTRATHSPLHEYLTVGRTAYPRDGFFLRAESFYNVATNIDEMDEAPSFGPRLIDSYGGVSLHDQSHGESFLALVEQPLRGQWPLPPGRAGGRPLPHPDDVPAGAPAQSGKEALPVHHRHPLPPF